MRQFRKLSFTFLGLLFLGHSLTALASCDGLINPAALNSVGIELTTSDVDELSRLSTAHGSSDSRGVNVGYAGFSVGLSGSDSSSDKKDEFKSNQRSATHYVVSSVPVLGMADAYIKCRQLEAGANSIVVDPKINGLASLDIGLSTLSSTDHVDLVGLHVRPVAQFGDVNENGGDLVTCFISEVGKTTYNTISNKPGIKVVVGAPAAGGTYLSRVIHCDRKPLPTVKAAANPTALAQYLPVVIDLEFATHDIFQFSLPWSGGRVPSMDTLEALQGRIATLEATAGQVDVTQYVNKTIAGISEVDKYMGTTKAVDVVVNVKDERALIDADAGLVTHGTSSDKSIFKAVSVIWLVDEAKQPCSENITTVGVDGRSPLSISGRCFVLLQKGVHHLQLRTSIGTWETGWRNALKDVSGHIRVSSVPVRALTTIENIDATKPN